MSDYMSPYAVQFLSNVQTRPLMISNARLRTVKVNGMLVTSPQAKPGSGWTGASKISSTEKLGQNTSRCWTWTRGAAKLDASHSMHWMYP